LPVASPAEKSGRFVTWEGRRRPFDLTLTGSGALSDGQVLDALAEELDVTLGLRTVAAARAELLQLGLGSARPAPPAVTAAATVSAPAGSAVLATWPELLDAGRAQVGDEHLAGTAKPARALVSAGTAAQVGVAAGQQIALSTDRGSIVLDVQIAAMPDGIVWAPTNARGCAVRATLGAGPGSVVTLTSPAAPPVAGLDGGAE
jgi:NADH-quinone oxidoreductase subunit G